MKKKKQRQSERIQQTREWLQVLREHEWNA